MKGGQVIKEVLKHHLKLPQIFMLSYELRTQSHLYVDDLYSLKKADALSEQLSHIRYQAIFFYKVVAASMKCCNISALIAR